MMNRPAWRASAQAAPGSRSMRWRDHLAGVLESSSTASVAQSTARPHLSLQHSHQLKVYRVVSAIAYQEIWGNNGMHVLKRAERASERVHQRGVCRVHQMRDKASEISLNRLQPNRTHVTWFIAERLFSVAHAQAKPQAEVRRRRLGEGDGMPSQRGVLIK